jgi:hypothetical protein
LAKTGKKFALADLIAVIKGEFTVADEHYQHQQAPHLGNFA